MAIIVSRGWKPPRPSFFAQPEGCSGIVVEPLTSLKYAEAASQVCSLAFNAEPESKGIEDKVVASLTDKLGDICALVAFQSENPHQTDRDPSSLKGVVFYDRLQGRVVNHSLEYDFLMHSFCRHPDVKGLQFGPVLIWSVFHSTQKILDYAGVNSGLIRAVTGIGTEYYERAGFTPDPFARLTVTRRIERREKLEAPPHLRFQTIGPT